MSADQAASGVSRMALESASSAGSQGSGAGSGAGGGMIASWKTAFRAASDAVVGLPPRETTLPLLRLSTVLLRLSELIYLVDDKYLDSTVGIELPIAGRHGDRASVVAKLVHFRGAVNSDGLSSPEQFGVWEVDGVGLCVAFRGTASTEDVLIDVNITPTPLETSRNMRGVGPIEVHQGFYQGAKRQLPDIQSVVAAHAKTGGKRLPVWITGHSLGGGYANAVMLHMLANRTCAELFGAGGGSVTFGAPMVVYATDPVKLYDNLQRLEAYAEQQAGDAHPPLQFHNYVNGADIVPRLLGASLDRVHSTIGSYFQILQYFTAGVQKVSKYYHPFGTYHFILGAEIRTPPGSTTARSCSGGGRIGDAAYAELIAEQLALDNVLKHYMRGAANGPAVDHFLASYETGLRGHMEAVAGEQATAESDRDTAALFVLPAAGTPAERSFTHSVGATVGSASWSLASAAAAVAGKAALARIASGNAASSTGTAGDAAAGGKAAAGGTWGSYLSGVGSSALRAAATAAQGATGEDGSAAARTLTGRSSSSNSRQRAAGAGHEQEL